ncbi:hypothetical protein [Mycobacterium sp. JS623]|uniref:hypothetical protein n=1 Tax=Mycobacterium sp. JS623 TaxID=212767 RepID=UPI002FF656B5
MSNEENTAVVMVTHDRDAASYGTRELHLVDGRAVDAEAVPLLRADVQRYALLFGISAAVLAESTSLAIGSQSMQLLGANQVAAQKADRLPASLLIATQSVLDQRDGQSPTLPSIWLSARLRDAAYRPGGGRRSLQERCPALSLALRRGMVEPRAIRADR